MYTDVEVQNLPLPDITETLYCKYNIFQIILQHIIYKADPLTTCQILNLLCQDHFLPMKFSNYKMTNSI